MKNKHVGWPYRVVLGFPTWIFETVLPGRVFPWGDYYNPWSNTAHLYSDHPAISLHEAGHAHDTAKRTYKGTYAFVRILPFVDLYQEYKASDEAIDYLRESQKRDEELRAYKILHPAYGTYVGSYFFAPIGTVAGAVVGHISGRSKAKKRKKLYDQGEAG